LAEHFNTKIIQFNPQRSIDDEHLNAIFSFDKLPNQYRFVLSLGFGPVDIHSTFTIELEVKDSSDQVVIRDMLITDMNNFPISDDKCLTEELGIAAFAITLKPLSIPDVALARYSASATVRDRHGNILDTGTTVFFIKKG
jgi:hypothetical protein